MSLQNLLAIQRLQTFEATPGGVQRMLAAAGRNLTDAGLTGLSADNRFDAAYKTIMQCAMVGLWANGYRPAHTRQWLASHHPALLVEDR